jgi:hypothetical protein
MDQVLQLLLQAPFPMAMRCLDDAVLMGHAAVVATGGKAVMDAKGPLAACGREPIGAQLLEHLAAGSLAILQALRKCQETLAAVNDLTVGPATPGQPLVEQQMGE